MEKIIPKIVILLGPPGSGKGTQAKLLQERYDYHYLSTGDLIREAIKKAATGDPLAMEIKSRYDQGEPQPDNLILKMVREKLNAVNLREGIIFDAFPLSDRQAWGLDEIIEESGKPEVVALNIEVGEEETITRLSLRKYCPQDNSVYYPKSPTYDQDLCAVCGGKLVRRADDAPAVVRERYQAYQSRIRSLVHFYEKRRQLIRVDGEQTVEGVAEEMFKKLGAYQPTATNA